MKASNYPAQQMSLAEFKDTYGCGPVKDSRFVRILSEYYAERRLEFGQDDPERVIFEARAQFALLQAAHLQQAGN